MGTTYFGGGSDYTNAMTSGSKAPLYDEARNFTRGEDFYQPLKSAYKPWRKRNQITDVMQMYSPQKRSAMMNDSGMPMGTNQMLGSAVGGLMSPFLPAAPSTEMPYDPWLASGGYNTGVYDFYKGLDPNFQAPVVPGMAAAPNTHTDRTYTSGGIGKNATGQHMIPDAGMPNFGSGFLNTGTFGAKGLQAIQDMGFADQSAYLAANPQLQAAYDKKNPSIVVKGLPSVGPSVLPATKTKPKYYR